MKHLLHGWIILVGCTLPLFCHATSPRPAEDSEKQEKTEEASSTEAEKTHLNKTEVRKEDHSPPEIRDNQPEPEPEGEDEETAEARKFLEQMDKIAEQLENFTDEDIQELIDSLATDDNAFYELLRQAIDCTTGISTRNGPAGGRLACAWANSLARKEFLNLVKDYYGPEAGPAIAAKLDIGWSNGVTDTYGKLQKNPYWIEVDPKSIPDGMPALGVVLDRDRGTKHGHIGWFHPDGVHRVHNSSSRAEIIADKGRNKFTRAFIPVLPFFSDYL